MRYKKGKTGNIEKYVPNEIPRSQRIANKLVIIFLIFYGSYGVYNGSLYLPLGRGEVTLQGNAVYFGFASLLLGALYFLIEIFDHYDKRNNEFTYKRIRDVIKGLAALILLFTIAISAALTYEI
ncbi:hypothetical protein [Pseudoalteromonas viridis]|uniref:DUF202 domain-containing protein n=1 Tax=Pseudoalteromonas viridis TaxID=339617 RepID=A0ABX7V916_9GAMM|nr:hypothetical protein [Pseudoalteromonas viridis]QTL34999.1 hypothetical protein J5X90_15945 [Pseudoalteromonas viridis]